MEISLISIYVGGGLTALMALFFSQFYRLLNWKEEFKRIGWMSQRLLTTIYIAQFLSSVGFASISFVYARELSKSQGLALGINLFLSVFWLWRTIWQIYYFKNPSENKTGPYPKYGMILLFTSICVSYLIPVILTGTGLQ